jgi:hypothetical protein
MVRCLVKHRDVTCKVMLSRCIQKFPDWVDNEIIINTRWEAIQRVMAAKLTILTHKIATQLYLVANSCTICSSRSRRPVRKLLDTPSCITMLMATGTNRTSVTALRHISNKSPSYFKNKHEGSNQRELLTKNRHEPSPTLRVIFVLNPTLGRWGYHFVLELFDSNLDLEIEHFQFQVNAEYL